MHDREPDNTQATGRARAHHPPNIGPARKARRAARVDCATTAARRRSVVEINPADCQTLPAASRGSARGGQGDRPGHSAPRGALNMPDVLEAGAW